MWRRDELERWRRESAATYKARERGTLGFDQDRLEVRYNAATRGKRRRVLWRSDLDPLFEATGDPLVQQDRDLAAKLYGLSNAPRPSVALRRIRAASYGDDALSAVTDMAIWFQMRRRWSVLRSAGEAVALAAERGIWIGAGAPVSFGRAVESVRKSVGRMRVLNDTRYSPRGWTGRELFMVPVSGYVIPMPDPPGERLPSSGRLVPDDAFWRRRLKEGCVVLGTPEQEEKGTQRSNGS